MVETTKQRRDKSDREQLINLVAGKAVFIIPHKLTLMGETYTTKVSKNLLHNGKAVNGYIDHIKNIIHLKKQGRADRTYIHEVIHARDRFFGWKINSTEQEKESLVRIETEWWLQYFNQIFPIARLAKNFKTDSPRELIKKLQADIKRKDKQIEKLTAQLNTKKKKKAKSSVKQTAQKLKTKLTRRTK